jgi:phosphoglycolate phosphatase-like HAD superfamily hydrolase
MLMQFIEDCCSLPLEDALMVGDRVEDEQCAKNAGINFIWANDWR